MDKYWLILIYSLDYHQISGFLIITFNRMAINQKFQASLKLVPYVASTTYFYKYIADSANNKQKLYQQIRACRIDQCKCRFNVWRLLMGVLPLNGSLQQKIKELNNQRESYKTKRAQAFNNVSATITSPKKQGPLSKNPLMKAMVKTTKVQQPDDNFLRDEIRKDVQRTYQQIQFFLQLPVIKLLSDVLFVWCKRNPEVSYKQGMNEVLASIVYVYFQQTYSPSRRPDGFLQINQEAQSTYVLFNSIQYAQGDIYSVFEKIMNIQHKMYYTQTDSNLKGAINPNSKNNTPILQRIITIIDQKLKSLDIELFRTLKLRDIQPKTFLLKWIRCMHTREFSLENSFIIWDSIFLDYWESPSSKQKSQFQFIDAMCVAMFVYMRSIALTRETAYEILQTYQKYPSLKKGGYLEQLMNLAWSLCDALRQPTNLGANDWVGQQNTKIDNKIKLLKSRDSPVFKNTKEKEQVVVATKTKQVPKPKQNVIEVKQTKVEQKVEPKVQKKVQLKPQPVNETNGSTQQKQVPPQLNINITLQAPEWQLLVQTLQKSLSLNSDEESRKFTLQAIQILKNKVMSATNRY